MTNLIKRSERLASTTAGAIAGATVAMTLLLSVPESGCKYSAASWSVRDEWLLSLLVGLAAVALSLVRIAASASLSGSKRVRRTVRLSKATSVNGVAVAAVTR